MKIEKIALGVMLVLFITGCSQVKVGTDPYNDDFFEKEKLLMSKTELDLYKHLPDKESKMEFIADFWKRRDPSPFTDENELKDKFDQRVAHAQKWFYERGAKNSGWNTDRGRVYILFGQPDRQETTEVQRPTGGMVNMILWSYDRYQMDIRFIDEMGLNVYYLTHNSQYMLLRATEKLLQGWGLEGLSTHEFTFQSKYINQGLEISVPLKNLQVATEEENIIAKFQVDIIAYSKNKKIEEITVTRDLTYPKDEAVKLKAISFVIPYPLEKKGRYYFDIIVKNTVSSQQFRDFLKTKR